MFKQIIIVAITMGAVLINATTISPTTLGG
jgi:hypothetical protein